MEDKQLMKVSEAQKYTTSPFIDDVFKIDSKKKTIIAGRTNKILVDSETGESEGICLLHRYKEVDQEKFVKLYLAEVSSLFELTKTGLKVFGYIVSVLQINSHMVYLHIPDLMTYCEYKSKVPVYRGLGELLSNKIIAMSTKTGWWYVNPNIIFNGDRIAFIKEYRLTPVKKLQKSEQMVMNELMQGNYKE
jgi:hypothetical protein